MGNCPGCFSSTSIHDAGEEDSVKVVRVTDGELFEYPGPVYVKDLMYGFEGFAVFHFGSSKQPLPPERELKLSELYYLKPWVSASQDKSQIEDGEAGSDQKPVQGARKTLKKVRFNLNEELPCPPQDVSNSIAESVSCKGLPAMELLPQEQNGVFRLKLVLSKKQLSELMSSSTELEEDALVLEKIVAPLLSPKSAARVENVSPLVDSWRPCLEQIPEVRETRSDL